MRSAPRPASGRTALSIVQVAGPSQAGSHCLGADGSHSDGAIAAPSER
jgi:hypothetical protein